MALIVTPGAADANSYDTLDELDAFNADRPQSAWSSLTAAQKEAAALWATPLFDGAFVWTGNAADGVQALAWPRVGMLTRNGYPIPSNVIPIELKRAFAEFTRQLADDDLASDNSAIKQGITGIKAGSVSLSFEGKGLRSQDVIDAQNVESTSDFFYLSKTVPDAVRIVLVSSWYKQRTSTRRPIFFKVQR